MMNKSSVFLALIVWGMAFTSNGQQVTAVDSILLHASELRDQKKYASAFSLLEQHDPNNQRVDFVLAKEDLCINYFVTSLAHQMFAFKDIGPDEDIMDYRGVEGTAALHMFAVNEVLDSLVGVYPEDCRLHKGLGDFYFDVHLRYGSGWLMEEQEMFEKMKASYEKVLYGSCEDYMTSYVLGYIALLADDIQGSIPMFTRSIEQNGSYATSHYNLAYAYLFSEDHENALKCAVNALNLYEDGPYKADAARLAGQVCVETEKFDEALRYLNESDRIQPGNYYTLGSMIHVYLKTGDARSREVAESLFRIAPDDIEMYQMLEQPYMENEKQGELEDIYGDMLKEFKDDDMVCGTIWFFTASHYVGFDNKKVVECCEKARKHFIRVLPEDHPAIQTIDETIQEFSDK